MLIRNIIYFFVLLTIFSNNCFARQTLMTEVDNKLMDTLVTYAKRNYPRIKLFDARTNASRANLQRQKLGWFESLTFSYVLQPKSGTALNATKPVFLNGGQVGLFVNVGSLLQRPAIIKQAKEELKAFEQEGAEYNLSITAEVRKRYYAYLQQAVMLRLISRSVIDGAAMVESARVRYEKSELSFDEYSKLIISTNGNIQSKLEIEATLLTAISSLDELTGTGFLELKKKYGTQ